MLEYLLGFLTALLLVKIHEAWVRRRLRRIHQAQLELYMQEECVFDKILPPSESVSFRED